MPVTIRNRWTDAVIATVEDTDSIREAVIRLMRQGVSLRSANLSGSNLSGSDLSDSDLSGSDLRDSNLSGSDLSDSNLSGSDLRGSNLSGSDLSDSDLSGSDLRDSNLSGSDLRGSNLSGSDLSDSNLRDSNLRDSDLGKAINQYAKVPSLNRRILAAIEAGGSLEMSTWHTCDTTHCRAGWAIHLAGPAGAMLEACVGSVVAGALIHQVSCPQLDGKVPNFYASNEEALADIKWLAELEPELATN